MTATMLFSAPPAAHTRRPGVPRPAAGILLRHTDADGSWYLLGLRALRLGGTWSNIGGSLNPGETPIVGALREFYEELAVPAHELDAALVSQVIESGTDAVPYTLFVIDVDWCLDDAILSWENIDLAWWLADDVPTLHLHDGFARAWDQIRPTTLQGVPA